MPIRRGTAAVTKVYRGSTAVTKVYRGSSLVHDFTAGQVAPRAMVRSFSSASFANNSGGVAGEIIDRPGDVLAGDLLVLFVFADSAALTAFTPPTGFTQLGEARAGTDLTLAQVSYKIAGGSEPNTYSPAAYSTSADGGAIMVAVGNWTGSTANLAFAGPTATPGSSSTHAAPSVLAKTAKNLVLAGVAQDANNATTWTWGAPSGMTKVEQVSNSLGWASAVIARKDHDAASQTGAQAFTVSTGSATAGMGWTLVIPSA